MSRLLYTQKNNNMKILYIIPGYIQSQLEFMQSVNEAFDIKFLSIKKNKSYDPMPETARLSLNYEELGLKGIRVHHFNIQSLFLLFKKIYKEIRANKIDLIISATQCPVHAKIGYMLAKLSGIKIGFVVQTWNDHKFNNPLMMLYQKLTKYILTNADICLPNGTNAKKYCLRCGIPEEKIFPFNFCSGDLANINKNLNDKLTFDIDNRKIIILYLGRLVPVKGIDILIRAYAKLEKEFDNLLLLIAGDGDEKGNLQNLVDDLKIKTISFAGLIQSKEVPALIGKSDLVVQPSVRKGNLYEGWGLAISEAMSLGKPVIATDAVGCSPDLIQDGHNGFVVKNGNTEELYQAMRIIIGDGALRVLMGRNSRRKFEEFSNVFKRIEVLNSAIKFLCKV